MMYRKKQQSVRLVDYAGEQLHDPGLKTRLKESPGEQRMLLRYMEIHDFFGIEHSGNGREIVLINPPESCPLLELWMRARGHTISERRIILLDALWKMQGTKEWLSEWEVFQEKEKLPSERELICLDYLGFLYANPSAPPEIQWGNKQNLEKLMADTVDQLPNVARTILVHFCEHMLKKYGDPDTIKHLEYRQGPTEITHATKSLSFETFSRLAYIVFSENRIDEYVKKAAANRTTAEILYLTAMHFVCALRIPDMSALPVPGIPLHGTELKESLIQNKFSICDAEDLVNSWLYQIQFAQLRPQKTRKTAGVSQLVVSIPSSLFPVFGKILAVLVSYHEEGEQLVVHRNPLTRSALRLLFGEEFVQLAGTDYFLSTRSLNKAYLQCAEHLADKTNGFHMPGYVLASIMRSHKLYYGKFSEVTDTYLRDGAFADLAPEVVAQEMFERGVFGFLPVILLNQYRKEWSALNVRDQTLVIQELAITPVQLEHITELLQNAIVNVQALFVEAFQKELDTTDVRSLVGHILKRLAEGTAPGKDLHNLCLRSAVDLPCCHNERSSCLGCGYEIWTRVSLHCLLEEFERNEHLLEQTGISEVERYKRKTLNRLLILPALQEIIVSIQTLYGNQETAENLICMIQRRLERNGNKN